MNPMAVKRLFLGFFYFFKISSFWTPQNEEADPEYTESASKMVFLPKKQKLKTSGYSCFSP